MDASEVDPVDMVVIATKADSVEAAARSALPILGPDTVVVTIQNGLGSAERVAGVIGADRLVVGIVGGFGASIPSPGHAHHNGWEFLHLGAHDARVSGRLQEVVEAWRSAGFTVQSHDDIEAKIWEKFICNVAFSGTCALTTMTIGEVMADENAWSVASTCAQEAFAVAAAKAIVLPIEDVEAYVRTFGGRIPNARPSMLLDHLAGRRSEIDVINGAVPRLATAAGLSAPVNETVSALIRARERAFS
jgi:2-dehydropantoate 2-reductase